MISKKEPVRSLTEDQEKPIVKRKGICGTCIYGLDCVHVESPENPKIFCEEYESEEHPAMRISEGGLLNAMPDSLRQETEDLRKARELGLCFNCAHREGCSFQKPEGGVWHCEEYCLGE
jgi:hypothetical protein